MTTPSQILKQVSLAADIAKPGLLPILGNLVIGNNQIRATDMESQITIAAPFDFEPYTVPAAKFKGILATLPVDAAVKLDHKDGKLTVKAGRSKFGIQTLPVEDFPLMELSDPDHEISMPQEKLKAMLQHVQHATANHDVRQYLNGVFLEVKDGQLTVVGTDGYRMAWESTSMDCENISAIIPRASVGRLIKFLNEGPLTIKLHVGKASFQLGDIEFITKLIDGTYPNYSRIIPKNPHSILLDRELFIEAISRASIVLDKQRAAKLTIGTDLVVECSNAGEAASDDFPANWKGTPIEISMNPDYLLDALHVLGGDEITLAFGSPRDAFMMSNADGLRVVIMPMRA